MRFGVHVSIADGFARSVARAEALGCDAFQIFAGNPRGWARKPLTDTEAAGFQTALAASGLGPVVVHLSYLPNPASLDDQLYGRSLQTLREDFARASRLGAAFFVLHPGTCAPEHKAEALARVIRGIEAALAEVTGPIMLLLENQGSRRRDLAADLAELVLLLENLDPVRVGICLDTCHAFVAGYDLRTLAGWRETLSVVTGKGGLERLKVVHANDSRGDLGSGLDRHAHIGQGFLGESAFAALADLPELADRTVILETPQDDPGDDPRNLAAIRRLTAEGR